MSIMQPVEALKRQYQGEWLAIHVRKEGPAGPEEGELVYHARDVREVWQRLKGDRRRIYVTYAGPLLEEGWAAAF
jgi:hypothetical protein